MAGFYGISAPCFVDCGNVVDLPMLANHNGVADIQSEYGSLNALRIAASHQAQLKCVFSPLSTLAAIYILTGGDYISIFFF